MRFKTYPKTKPSGVEWLGDVPEHWEVKTLRRCLLEHRQGYYSQASYVNEGVKLLRITDLRGHGRIDFAECPMVEDLSELSPFLLKHGDFVFARTGGAGAFGLVDALDEPVAYASYLIRFRFDSGVWPAFLQGFFLSSGFQSAFKQNVHGGVNQNVHAEDIKDLLLAIPPQPEQTAIAAYLDRETDLIDELVSKKTDLIGRLKEKRTALISRTVTRGLPADLPPETLAKLEAIAGEKLPFNAPLKPSGIDWLGDVPEHWEVMKFRRLITSLDQGWSPNANNYPAAPGELGVLKLGAASKGQFYPEDNKALDEIPEGVIPITPGLGDLLLSRANTPDLVGEVCVVREDYPKRIIPDLLYRLRLRADTNAEFVCWFLLSRSGRSQIECDARGSSGSMVKLGQGHVRAWSIPFPPLPEQCAIAAYLDEETARLDDLVAKVETAIERLQEYRIALITAAVTGKIDVRE